MCVSIKRFFSDSQTKTKYVDASSKCARCNRSATNDNMEEQDPGEGPSQPPPQDER